MFFFVLSNNENKIEGKMLWFNKKYDDFEWFASKISAWTQVAPASDGIRIWTKLEYQAYTVLRVCFLRIFFLSFLSFSLVSRSVVCNYFFFFSFSPLIIFLVLFFFFFFLFFFFFFLSTSHISRKTVRQKRTNITTENRVKHINRTEMSKNAVKQQRVCYYWKNRTNQRLMSECVHVE